MRTVLLSYLPESLRIDCLGLQCFGCRDGGNRRSGSVYGAGRREDEEVAAAHVLRGESRRISSHSASLIPLDLGARRRGGWSCREGKTIGHGRRREHFVNEGYNVDILKMALRCVNQLHYVLCTSINVLARPTLRTYVRSTAMCLNACRQCVGSHTMQTRHLATKKSKGALDHIIVVTKDGRLPLNQIGQISLKSPQLIIVNMTNFPESTAAAEKAIRESKMNLNPEVDGSIIRVQVPPVTRDHRENLAKLAKQLTNKAKDSLRRVRTNAVIEIKKSKNSVSEDTIKLLEKQVQQMADDVATEMDKHLATKTKELLG
ncbi:ribosome-recycling factor, mitochondrial isoform X2 [Ambystoma mexicanum]|uniref:ribosome-recycling factor, mitochondrial isoform X2 n=1 Tax=Ambystoma mexicanum TaxID=8296 RepID=UPI0037E8C675